MRHRLLAVPIALAIASIVHADDFLQRGHDTALAARSGQMVRLDDVPAGTHGTVDLELERFFVTNANTRFVVGRKNGKDIELDFDPDSVTLLRGTVAGDDDSHAFVAISETSIVGSLSIGGEHIGISAGAAAERAEPASSPPVQLCACDTGHATRRIETATASVAPGPRDILIRIAIESDYEFYSLFGDLDRASEYMVQLWGAVSDIYQRDLDTSVVLSYVRLWDDADDLFNEESPLAGFRNYWNENMGEIERDVAQFVSGRRDMPYGGAAYLNAVCGNAAYGVTGYVNGFFPGPDRPDHVNYDVRVTAHELGHNCGALHTHNYELDNCNLLYNDPQRGSIMSYCSQTVSGGAFINDLRFHSVAALDMREFLETVVDDCLVYDCNGNGINDTIDILDQTSDDANGDGIPDECQDCNDNGLLDPEEIADGLVADVNVNNIPDPCEPDCNLNGIPDEMDIRDLTSVDDNGNFIPDECEVDCDGSGTADWIEINADLSLDINRDRILDSCQDCDGDGVIDREALAGAHGAWIAAHEGGAVHEVSADSGVLVRASAADVLSHPMDVLITDDARILVSSAEDHRVVEFDRFGAVVGDLITGGGPGELTEPSGMTIGPDGRLYVASTGSNEVYRYELDGAFVDTFVTAGSGGLNVPHALAFGPDGNLYVGSDPGSVLRYDGSTGDFISEFVGPPDDGGLRSPRGLLFRNVGDLLVTSKDTNSILRYDGTTGAFIEQWNRGGTSAALTLDEPWCMRRGPDGLIYVSRHGVHDEGEQSQIPDDYKIGRLHINATRIYGFDENSGLFMRSYVTGHDTGIWEPTGFDFYPGDDIDCNHNQIIDSCDIASGYSDDVNGNGIPDECEDFCPGDVDGDGTVGVPDLLLMLGTWGPCFPAPPCDADLTGDLLVNVDDLLLLISNWGRCP